MRKDVVLGVSIPKVHPSTQLESYFPFKDRSLNLSQEKRATIMRSHPRTGMVHCSLSPLRVKHKSDVKMSAGTYLRRGPSSICILVLFCTASHHSFQPALTTPLFPSWARARVKRCHWHRLTCVPLTITCVTDTHTYGKILKYRCLFVQTLELCQAMDHLPKTWTEWRYIASKL